MGRFRCRQQIKCDQLFVQRGGAPPLNFSSRGEGAATALFQRPWRLPDEKLILGDIVMCAEFDFITISCIAGIMAVAVFTDLRSRTIPNRLTCLAMVFMFGYYGMTYGFDGMCFSTKGLLLGTALLLPVYFAGGMGAGDAKLMGAVGAALGAQGVINAFLFTAIAGGLYAIGIVLCRYGKSKGVIARTSLMLRSFVYSRRFTCIPEAAQENAPKLYYAIPIAIGTAGAIAWHLAYRSYLI